MSIVCEKIFTKLSSGQIEQVVVSVFINNYPKVYNFNVNKGGHYAEV